ncbi:flagella basal body P-ring formation protein FlgA [Komagataeibacter melaceti]|uniref:Flagella basal body P-ring formation protein FlgA n=1 Tax=Komagataeibacter melaceti TaxID=2766577 RepID=A0A371Z522_9PROT|nr:flagellar basal body P-ring formation chaperone FlgA [Komagataeibacter melaceti]RFD21580.1 flagella basal body P-ring formation protein FlgA [Komagataeibacter melaceti]
MTFHIPDVSAATLRNTTVITSDNVRLSDLFADLDPGQDQVIGPAPAPGGSIHVGGRQLIAIADQYGVDWLDQSPSALATITRSGRVLDQDFFVNLIRKSVPDVGNGPVSVDLVDFHPMIVAPDDQKPVILTDIDWDQKSGRFSATVYRTHPIGDVTQDSFLLIGTVHASQTTLVFTHPLAAGATISSQDVRIGETSTEHTSGRVFTDETEVDGMTLVHDVAAGEPVMDRDLHRTILMHKGDPILIVYIVPGIRLTATGKALEDGGAGQYLRALNMASNMIVTGRVTGPSQIEVETGSGAVPSDPNMLRRLATSNRTNTRANLSLR